MNLYALILLCASAISITLGVSVYSLNIRARVNRLFMLTMLANTYWAFCLLMISQSSNIAEATLWGKVLSFWPFLPALMLHFALAFNESDVLRNKLFQVLLYFPALLFSLIDLTTNWIFALPALDIWGYNLVVQVDSIVGRFYGVWSAVLGLLVVFAFAKYYSNIIDKSKKRQTKFIAAGFSIPIIISIFVDSIFPVMGLNFPVIGPVFGSITGIFVVYAMLKYELFSFRPEIAAENVFSTMPDSFILVNLKGVIIKVNRSLIELTGYSEEELIGKAVIDLLWQANVLNGKSTVPKLFAHLQEVREVSNYEIGFDTKAGKRRIAMLSCSMITDNNGHDVGTSFILNDITGRKEMEAKLLRSERFASIGELAAILGHDLRNPLSGIRGAWFFVKRKHSDVWDAEDIVMFESIDKSIDYSNKIINDLLDYSREIHLDLAAVTPKVLFADVLSFAALPSNVELVNELEDGPTFHVDPVKMCRVFVNVIKNAVDAMPEGGKLVIKSKVENGSLVFTFIDNGLGMSGETLEKIWTPLFTTKAKGMGFGLAICKRLVEAHNGRVSLSSVVDEGTTVRVELPLSNNATVDSVK
jgi:PAS domain S-box-containing protein